MPNSQQQVAAQFITSTGVAREICRETCHNLQTLSGLRILVLAVLGGAFISMGGLLSILLSTGINTQGVALSLWFALRSQRWA